MKKQLLIIVFFSLVSVSSALAQLQNTGWRRPAATHFPNDWTTPQNAFYSDDLYAEVLHQSGCRCPFLDLSWDNGISYSNSNIFGPYGTTDSFKIQGDSSDNWGYSWSDMELSDSAFVLRIWNSSTLLRQGYSNFGFGIPAGSSISGIEVRLEAQGDSNYTMDMVDAIEVKVYYYLPTATSEVLGANRNINVFPSPARHSIYLRFNQDTEIQKVQIASISGAFVALNEFSTATRRNDYEIDVSQLSPGIYFLNIISGLGTFNSRIVIQE